VLASEIKFGRKKPAAPQGKQAVGGSA